MEEPRRVRVVVDGRVQGVFFRATCAERARAAGLAGGVRNRADGTVEAVFEGEAQAVAGLVAWCREGPRHAVVRSVEVTDEPVEGTSGFSVG